MYLLEYEKIRRNHVQHWAETLEAGDRCKATIRHKTDGSKNRHNVDIVVIENLLSERRIIGYFDEITESIPYNELTKV